MSLFSKVWVVCYINLSRLDKLDKELKANTLYEDVEFFIPKVKVFKKKYKQKNIFEEAPLLFNYGFVKVPRYFLNNPEFLFRLKKEVTAIYGWMKDPSVKIKDIQTLYDENHLPQENPAGLSLATEEEIIRLADQQGEEPSYSQKDIDELTEGMVIKLKHWPWENIDAKVITIDVEKRKVTVELLLSTTISKATLTFDQIFYTIYSGENLTSSGKEVLMSDLTEGEANFITKIRY
jgi:transcription antitermination factor NusG